MKTKRFRTNLFEIMLYKNLKYQGEEQRIFRLSKNGMRCKPDNTYYRCNYLYLFNRIIIVFNYKPIL